MLHIFSNYRSWLLFFFILPYTIYHIFQNLISLACMYVAKTKPLFRAFIMPSHAYVMYVYFWFNSTFNFISFHLFQARSRTVLFCVGWILKNSISVKASIKDNIKVSSVSIVGLNRSVVLLFNNFGSFDLFWGFIGNTVRSTEVEIYKRKIWKKKETSFLPRKKVRFKKKKHAND